MRASYANAQRARARTLIFDLDNTLHDASAYVFPRINAAMTAYIREHLRLDESQAHFLRQHYWRRYGATLGGLMRHHGTNPHHFLRETHRFESLEALLVTDAQLLRTLRKLPARKLLFSNAPRRYVSAVLHALSLADVFDYTQCIEHTRFRPKPDLHGFRRLLGRAGVTGRCCTFVDDTLENLKAAKELHMRTVWIARATHAPTYVDVHLTDFRELALFLNRWR